MGWSSEHRAIGLTGIVALWVGCFDGAGAKGYPCASDDDCGPSLACADTGCCGGACLFGTEGSTTMMTATTTSTSSSTDASSTTIDPSTSSSSDSGSSESGPEPVCGNGEPEDGEECDDPAGNGDWRPCTNECTNAILHFTSDEDSNDDFCEGGAMCGNSWDRIDGATGPWGPGIYPLTPTLLQLVSRPFEIPDHAPDLVPRVEVRHSFDFNLCMPRDVAFYPDGAHVMVQRMDTMAVAELMPQPGDSFTGPIECDQADSAFCDPGPTPPLAFVGLSDGFDIPDHAEIPASFVGAPLRLVFELGSDTGNCVDGAGMGGGQPDAWLIDRVVVALVR